MVKGKAKLSRDILVDSLSENHVQVIESLDKPRYDEDVAEQLELKATVVRTILNDLHSAALVEYERSKNKKTGWYTYMWKRRDDKVDEYVNNHLQDKLINLTGELESEKKDIQFGCQCSVMPFESAMDTGFICNECGTSLEEHDNSEKIDGIVEQITSIKSLLEQTK